jgi:3D (Asp-Asp-Asp) domain-containing protein
MTRQHGRLAAGIVAVVSFAALQLVPQPPAHVAPGATWTRASLVPTSVATTTTTARRVSRGTQRALLSPGATRTSRPGVIAGPAAPGGVRVSATAYCETGTMANGQRTYDGAVAANRWAFGTRLYAAELGRTYTVADRIGSGSEFDIAMPGRCSNAIAFGRRTLHVQVVA